MSKIMKNNKNITVLLSCIGKQVYLVEAFRKALPLGGRVITTDADMYAAGAAVSDFTYIAPPINNPGYIDWILELCKKETVNLFITLLAEELLVLETNRRKFEALGTRLVGMPLNSLQTCLNKSRLKELCVGTGLKTPSYWEMKDIECIPQSSYPLMAKDVKAKGSRGQQQLDNRDDAKYFLKTVDNKKFCNYILQPLLIGEEYGLDLVNDLDSNFAVTLIRRKIRRRDCDTDIAESIDDEKLALSGRVLAKNLQHSGLVDCDVMRCKDGDYLLDINPRFGGGYIFSHNAGADVPAALIAWLKGCKPNPSWLNPMAGIISARYSKLQIISGDERT